MRKSIIYSISILCLLLVTSCSKFEELNTDPNNSTKVRSDLLLANIVYSAMGEDNDVVNQTGMYSTFVGGDMGACWAQHIGKVQYNDEERYTPRSGVVRAFWNTIYEDVCNDAKKMEKLAKDEGNTAVEGVALILQAYGFQVLTDCYGDIPFSDALKADANVFTPKYDKQEDVYKGILALLTDAANKLSTTTDVLPSSSDVMYGGDLEKWTKFANSLKFRALMRISSKDASTDIDVAAQLQALVTDGNLFSSNDDEAKFEFETAQPGANPFYETIVFGNRPEFRVGAPMIDILKSLGDPRLSVYAKKNEDDEYVGKPAGYINLPFEPYTVEKTSAIGSKFLAANAPAYFMSYPELLLLMAEAKVKGLISSGSAATYFSDGIRASMEAVGVLNADISAYLAIVSLSGDVNAGLSQIGTQKWIALFGQGIEAWIEWKRTKSPELQPAVNGAFNEIPSRYTYPSTEQSINTANYSAAVANQGVDELTTKIWWLK